MDFNERRIIIAYGGTLTAYFPHKSNGFINFLNKIKKYFWTYNNDIIDQTTRSANSLIQAISNLYSKNLIAPEDIHVLLWGNIDKQYHGIINKHGISDFFTIEGFKTKKETIHLLKQADLLFLPLESGKGNQKPLFIPGKLYEYLQFKKPILLLAEKESDCAKICMNAGLGIICEPKDHENLSHLLLDIINNDIHKTNLNPNVEYIESFSFKEKTKELSFIFDDLLD